MELNSFATEQEIGRAIQIASPADHSLQLDLDGLKQLLEYRTNDEMKDRQVVIVSIAGVMGTGKSFLLNILLKYLYARYMRRNVIDWFDNGKGNGELSGFEWKAGEDATTKGIWMWSEIFTHDFENGDKVAIFLLDTQGLFDNTSNVKDCTTLFTLSLLMSSVQCYNFMRTINESDLQYLQLFTEYGLVALEQTNETPFNNLILIIRDWPNAHEFSYGWSPELVAKKLEENNNQTTDMRMLRQRIKSSFEKINSFLLPHPGLIVTKPDFQGDLQQTTNDFRNSVKELTESIFAPENLSIKKINGEAIRVRDLMTYFEIYATICNGDTLPEPKSIFTATMEASYVTSCNYSLDLYEKLMQNALQQSKNFLEENQLLENHERAKEIALNTFVNKPKLGSNELAKRHQDKLKADIDDKFHIFRAKNEIRRSQYRRTLGIDWNSILFGLATAAGGIAVDTMVGARFGPVGACVGAAIGIGTVTVVAIKNRIKRAFANI